MAAWWSSINQMSPPPTYSGYYGQLNPGTATGQALFWPMWHNELTGTFTAATNPGTGITSIYWPVWHDHVVAPALIHSERDWQQRHHEAEVQRQAQYRQRAEVEAQRRKEVNARARELLFQHLTPEQRAFMEKHGWFVIQGGKSGKTYRIHSRTIAGNVEELEGEKAVARFCCHLEHQFPPHDHHLAQKLMLEHDEEAFLRLANKTLLMAAA